ncbi:MAG: aminopeptidase P family protein [Deltaproteobacteria bacterium]|nr:aminopeptidase P family protein [Deltaproteobacteria bacterium]
MRALLLAAAIVSLPLFASAQSGSSVRYKLDEVQASLAMQGIDGWLLVNNRRSNPVAIELINPTGNPAHEWFYLIPAAGKPAALVHESDRLFFASTGASLSTYSDRGKLRAALAKLLKGKKKVAAEYAPKSKIAALTRIDPATARLIQRTRVKLVSSANLVQFTKSLWEADGRIAHYVVAHHLEALRKQAFAHLRRELEAGRKVTEHDLQQLIAKGFEIRGIGGGIPAIASGPNTADPTYMPPEQGSRDIARGDLIRLTLWARLDGAPRPIYANMTWMAYVGDKIPLKYSDAFQLVARARDAAISLIRERVARRRTVKGYEPARAARKVISDAGLAAAFPHRTGHSLDTSVVGDGANLDDRDIKDTRPLVRGAGFTIEPGIYFKGDFGMKTEINVFIGRKGLEITTPVQRELTAIFAQK